MKNDIIRSSGAELLLLLFIFFFLSPCQGFLSGKIRSDPFHKFIVFPLSQLRKVQFIFYFLISIFVGATAQHPQHTDDKGEECPEKEEDGYTNIVPEEEKEGTIKKKRKRSKEERERISTIPSSVQLVPSQVTLLIAFDNFS